MWMRAILGLCAGAVFCLAVLASCTDADLMLSVDPDNPALRMQVQVTVCAPPPVMDDVPYKILFVIDTSLSNKWNDPRHKRHEAYVQAIDEFGGKANVYFGVITFNTTAHRPTVVFTQNLDVLNAAAEALWSTDQAVNGQTNFEDAMTEMLDFIVDDLNTMDTAVAQRTRYHVFWLSDGFPTEGTTNQPTLVANVVAVLDYVEGIAAEFVLNTLYLESSGVYETPTEITAARALLMAMADAGQGEFTNISQSAAIEFDINPLPVARDLVLAGFVVDNAHALFGTQHPLPDSDGDGLSDEDEVTVGTDPLLADTDGDGYRDRLELLTAWLLPTRVDYGCLTGELDTDGDGLFDCEEEVLRSNPNEVDTDGDLLPDGLEAKFGISVLVDDPMADVDLDGVQDWDEAVMHLDPLVSTSTEELDRWAYRYHLVQRPATPDGRPCYELTAENVGVFETQMTADHPRGGQVIEMTVAFRTMDQDIVVFKQARRAVGFRQPAQQTPATGLVQIVEADLVALSPPPSE